MKYILLRISSSQSRFISAAFYVTTFQVSWLVSIFGLQIVKNYRLATHYRYSPQWMGIEPVRCGAVRRGVDRDDGVAPAAVGGRRDAKGQAAARRLPGAVSLFRTV